MSDINDLSKRLEGIAEEVSKYCVLKADLEAFLKTLNKISEAEASKRKQIVLRGKSERDLLLFYDGRISEQLNEIKRINNVIISALGSSTPTKKLVSDSPGFQPVKPEVVTQAPNIITQKAPQTYSNLPSSKSMIYLDKKTKEKYIKDLNIDIESIRNLNPSKPSDKGIKITDYNIYKSSPFGNFSNNFFEGYSIKFSKQYPSFFDALSHNLRSADIKILSKTYISIMFALSVAAFLSVFLFAIVLVGNTIVVKVILSLFLASIAAFSAFMFMYMYPSMVAGSRKKRIKEDLPFVVLHMAAIAGSGAQPISMFNLILSSKEYKGVEGEITKIVNYVNLFGYNLTTALRAVSITTPSSDFKDLLNGLVVTIEGGGDLKSFLNSKADEIMTNYRLERKKYVEVLSTYSDVYTGVLIAAPLLFFMTLAIIRMFGTDIMGVSIATLASVGTYGVIPLLNVGFILFLNVIQPGST